MYRSVIVVYTGPDSRVAGQGRGNENRICRRWWEMVFVGRGEAVQECVRMESLARVTQLAEYDFKKKEY